MLYAITNNYRLRDIDFTPSIVLEDYVVKMGSGITLYIRAREDEDSRLRRAQPKPQNAACLIASVSFEAQYWVNPGHSMTILYTY